HVPVLAELAGEIAAGGPERQHGRARQEMVERLFLDRVDAKAGRAAIGREHHLIAAADAHEAEPALALVQLAVTRADVALDASALRPMQIAAGVPAANLLIHLSTGLRLCLLTGDAVGRHNDSHSEARKSPAARRGWRILPGGSGPSPPGG